ncbi:replicative DNA helicase [Planctomycetota bacterium]
MCARSVSNNPGSGQGDSAGAFSSRSMPESLSAEAALLGSMIIDPVCIDTVVEQISVDAFYRIEHQLLFEAIVRLYENRQSGGSDDGHGLDAVLLRDELEKHKHLEEVGGPEYIGRVMDSVPSSANVDYYTGVVKDKWVLRQIISAAGEILEDAFDETGLITEKLDLAEQKIFAVTNKNVSRETSVLKSLIAEAYERIEKRDGTHVTGLPTGYYELDDMTCGLQNSEMTIIAARPSMGKTSLALNFAEHIAIQERQGVAVFSLEMSKEQLAERLLCSNSQIESQLVRKGMLEAEQFQKLAQTCSDLADVPIFIDDTPGLTPLELRAKSRRLKSRYDIKCVIVDYLQLMSLGSGRFESRQQEITTISRYLKALARELSIPVVVLSQLNRAAESRDGHRPRMSDLRESGSIEQDADVVMLLHRGDYYHRGEEDYEDNNICEVIIAKQRNGPTGTVKLMFREQFTRFENFSHASEPF